MDYTKQQELITEKLDAAYPDNVQSHRFAKHLGALHSMHAWALMWNDEAIEILEESLKSGDPFEIKDDIAKAISKLKLSRLRKE